MKLAVLAASLAFAIAPAFGAEISNISLTASAPSVGFGLPLALTAAVSDSGATGRVVFYEGGNPLGSALLSAGTAVLGDVALGPGGHWLCARYFGDGQFLGSQSTPIREMITMNPESSWLNAVPYSTGFAPAAIAMGDFNHDGNADVVVVGSGVQVFLGKGDGTFSSSYEVTLATAAAAVSVSDFNNDGKLDVAIGSATGIAVYPGVGDGTFGSPVAGATNAVAAPFSVSDFNLDGNADLVLQSGAVLMGNGDGSFRAGTTLNVSDVIAVAVGDFNRDGYPDIVMMTYENLLSFSGIGDGTFQAPWSSVQLFENVTTEISVADIDNDGIPDLLTHQDQLVALFGQGDGTFQGGAIATAWNTQRAGFADINGDGNLDLLAFGSNTTTLGPLSVTQNQRGIPGPVISTQAVIPARYVQPGFQVLVASVAGTQGADFVYIEPGNSAFYVSLGEVYPQISLQGGNGPVTYGHPVTLTATFNPLSTTGTVVFYNGAVALGQAPVVNGTATLVTSALPPGTQQITAHLVGTAARPAKTSAILSQQVIPRLSSGLTQGGTFATGASPIAIATGDFNRDGHTDIITANSDASTLSVLLGKGDGTFLPGITVATGGFPEQIAVCDFNGDGTPDLVIANGNDDTVQVLLGKGDGHFTITQTYTGPDATTAVIAADLNGDGIPDLAATGFTGELYVFPGNGDGTFGAPIISTLTGMSGLYQLTAGDFNRDGIIDLALSSVGIYDTFGYSSVQAAIGNNSGYFNLSGPLTNSGAPLDLVTADFNGDGALDLAVADFGDLSTGEGGSVQLVTNVNNPNDPQSFGLSASFPAGMDPIMLTAGDVDGDGKQDVVVTNYAGFGVLLGNGDMTLRAPAAYATTSAQAIALGDFNGDGLVDVAVTNVLENNVQIFFGVPGACTYTLASPAAEAFDASGGAVTITIQTNGLTCGWNASGSAPWLAADPTVHTGSGSAVVTVQPNTTGADRTGSIQVGGFTVNVTQRFTTELFSDVLPSAYYFDAVNLLKGAAITSGCSPTTYCPTESVTRAQMAVFIVRSVLGGDNFTYSPTPYFTDVQPTDFGFAWIQKLYELGITTGCSATLYCPADSILRSQMAVFIIRARYGAHTAFDYTTTPYFTDVPSNAFAFNYIQRMKEDNITTGCTATTYCPNDVVTRGDMAIFIMRGAFNDLLPPTMAVVSSVSPATMANNTTATLLVTGVNTNFVSGATVVKAVPGLTVNSVTVTGPTTLTVNVTASVPSPAEPLSIWVTDPTEEAVLPNGLVVQ